MKGVRCSVQYGGGVILCLRLFLLAVLCRECRSNGIDSNSRHGTRTRERLNLPIQVRIYFCTMCTFRHVLWILYSFKTYIKSMLVSNYRTTILALTQHFLCYSDISFAHRSEQHSTPFNLVRVTVQIKSLERFVQA